MVRCPLTNLPPAAVCGVQCAGLVTDGSVRDTAVLREYGFPVFSISTTPRQGPHVHQPWSCNTVISCGGVAVRPGRGVVQNKHSTDVESPPPPPRVCMSIHTGGKAHAPMSGDCLCW